MNRWSTCWSLVAVVALLGLSLLVPGVASAHERRAIADGKAEVVVGWLVEPAYVNQPNGVDFRVTDPATQQPIEGLEKTVKVEITQGGVSRTFDLRARFGQKGAYTADLIPTRTGDYSFRFTGEINGAQINETFESGPGRFDGIKPLSEVQFPVQQASMGELESQLAAARSTADTARLIAIVGVVVGILGLAAAGVGLMRRPGAQPAGAPRQHPTS